MACFCGITRSKFIRVRAKSPFDKLGARSGDRRLEQWILVLRHGVARLGFEAFPQLVRAALAMEASRLGPAGNPEFFSRDLREISPTLNEDLLDLYGRSAQVLANQFAFHNISESLDSSLDWEMHESVAWRRELHSFDDALALAMTYRISQETRYAIHLRYLISHWIAQNPPGPSTGWELEPLARRVRNWALAADLVSAAWQDLEFQNVFSQSLAMQCVYLNQHAVESDSFTISLHCARALLVASRVFRAVAGDEFAERGRALLSRAMEAVFNPTPDQSLPRPTELFELAEACLEHLLFAPRPDDAAGPLGAESFRKILTTLEGVLAPDGALPLLGPSARSMVDELSDLFALAAVILDEPRWKNLAGKFGILPYLVMGERGRVRFEQIPDEPWDAGPRVVPELGLFRLGAGNRSALIVNARAAQSQPDHQDLLSYELHLEGRRVIVDSGAYSPEGETWNKYFASAQAHNVLLVDGHSPRPGAARVHAGEYALQTIGKAHAVRGDGETSSLRNEICPNVCLCNGGFDFLRIHHHRAFFNLDGGAWAVVDSLTGQGQHRVLNLIHFFPTFDIEVRTDCAVARSRALGAAVIPLGPSLESRSSESALRISRGPGANHQGFYSPDFGVKFPSSVLAIASGEIQLPWIGGYLIVPGAEARFLGREVKPAECSIAFELSGKPYCLRIP